MPATEEAELSGAFHALVDGCIGDPLRRRQRRRFCGRTRRGSHIKWSVLRRRAEKNAKVAQRWHARKEIGYLPM